MFFSADRPFTGLSKNPEFAAAIQKSFSNKVGIEIGRYKTFSRLIQGCHSEGIPEPSGHCALLTRWVYGIDQTVLHCLLTDSWPPFRNPLLTRWVYGIDQTVLHRLLTDCLLQYIFNRDSPLHAITQICS